MVLDKCIQWIPATAYYATIQARASDLSLQLLQGGYKPDGALLTRVIFSHW